VKCQPFGMLPKIDGWMVDRCCAMVIDFMPELGQKGGEVHGLTRELQVAYTSA
jgi:hypothetical protein